LPREHPIRRSRALQIVEAVWKVQSLSFAYSGYATVYIVRRAVPKGQRYSADLGARDTLRIRSFGCTDMVTTAAWRSRSNRRRSNAGEHRGAHDIRQQATARRTRTQ
jgi:hypothetical protein